MARSPSYSEAVRLLGGQDSKVVAALDKLTGGLLLAATPAVPALLGLFDAKAELVRLSHELVRAFSERRGGLSRHSRTRRLEAAHTVLVVAAFFEALAGADLPIPFRDLGLSSGEQLRLAGVGNVPVSPADEFWGRLNEADLLLPSPQEAPEDYRARLHDHYRSMARALSRFTTGLAVGERWSDSRREQFADALAEVPGRACSRYEESFRRLAADFPEVACWVSQREHRATRAALAGLEETLQAISTGRAPDQRRQGLARAYRADLGRLIVESGDVPDGIRVPALAEGYVPPRFRAASVAAATPISEESWWDDFPVRDDLQEFLIGHLTSPQAVDAPLLILGQPGAGKSVLTRILAARLPAADFLPVRVVLRDVPAADSVQNQIEHAVRDAIGDRVEWPALARSAGDAMPVILLDGFDELLQAIGVSQTDYLRRVARFQEREAEQGRPVAVIVTSRTAVANRARTPEKTVALRLEPFDEERITAWLGVWNSLNAPAFAARGLAPLAPEAVLAHRGLAAQPLLLLMLALYDADGNALQRLGGELRAHQLYEQLLRTFASREIVKHRPDLPDHDLPAAVENELQRLAVVAFAMINRAALWVTESDLEQDLAALLGPSPSPAGAGLRTPLGGAELTLGRFFFIHRARAAQDDARLETYEFLHATFGEFLVARFICLVLRDMAAREGASTMPFGSARADDDLLRALLSFQSLSLRGPIIEFLEAMAGPADPGERRVLETVLTRLYRTVDHTLPGTRYAGYRPASPGEPARYAAYSANLLLLLLSAGGPVRASDLYPGHPDVVHAWRAQAMLWCSQLGPDGWTSLSETIDAERFWDGDRRDLRLRLSVGQGAPSIDATWTFGVTRDSPYLASTYHNLAPELIRRRANLLCDPDTDVLSHALEPLAGALDIAVNTFVRVSEDTMPSAVHALLDLWVRPSPEGYRRCAEIAASDFPPWEDDDYLRYASLVLARLRGDDRVTAETAVDVLERILGSGRVRVRNAVAAAAIQVRAVFPDDAAVAGLMDRLRRLRE
ncbi:hypothetical protein GCM10010168_59990 [Actinoplanes ianthinogenes]|uniref:AAA+ ATPase domain-containing protein n=1 Tax=Actinoplanes ianthinogenes TaxID=122358 RepID=A0ABM7M3X1_9ACTN|nr:hypothetical protein [Actinoplanes ianthinogenes]BCJ46360.1 hypothetical protein Aiant_70170 [Actinoplanes ianthinogenes]GGR33750.1 hypothetical protein GCM10010168_59990 [Actinoplanes ianthinogenes]